DVALDVGATDLLLREADVESLQRLYRRYEFNAALKDLEARHGKPAAAAAQASLVHDGTSPSSPAADASAAAEIAGPGTYELVVDQERFKYWLQKLSAADLICFDTETTSMDAMRAEIVGVSFAVEAKVAAYIPLAHDYPGAPAQLDRNAVLQALKPLLEDPARAKVAQHAKYDINVLANAGIDVAGVRHDTMLQSYVLNSTATRHDMDSLARRHLGYQTISFEDVAGKGARQILFSQVDLETAGRYAAEDADITLRLHRALWPRLESEATLAAVYRDIEMPLVPVLARMERTGVLVDVEPLRAQGRELARRMQDLTTTAHRLAGRNFSLDSPKQLQGLLFDELKLPAVLKTPKGQPSTNEEALEAIAEAHELPRLILEYRGLAKLRSTYTEKL